MPWNVVRGHDTPYGRPGKFPIPLKVTSTDADGKSVVDVADVMEYNQNFDISAPLGDKKKDPVVLSAEIIGGCCFPLCEECWSSMTPKQRLPYYERLWKDWETSHKKEHLPPLDQADWESMKESVLAGK
jgi:hypothetical protein